MSNNYNLYFYVIKTLIIDNFRERIHITHENNSFVH